MHVIEILNPLSFLLEIHFTHFLYNQAKGIFLSRMLPHLQVSSKISKFLCLPHLVNYSSSIHHQFVTIFAIQQQNFALTMSILASFIYLFFYSALLALSLYSHPQVLPPQPAGTIAGHNQFSSHRHCSVCAVSNSEQSETSTPSQFFFFHILSHCTLDMPSILSSPNFHAATACSTRETLNLGPTPH